jgi:hypothetical protein
MVPLPNKILAKPGARGCTANCAASFPEMERREKALSREQERLVALASEKTLLEQKAELLREQEGLLALELEKTLLQEKAKLLREQEGLLALELQLVEGQEGLSARSGVRDFEGEEPGSVRNVDEFDDLPSSPYKHNKQIAEALDSAQDIAVLSLIQATIEAMVSEDRLLTKADAHYLNSLVHQEDAQLVAGFKDAAGNRQVFFDAVLKDILLSKAGGGMGNKKYAMYKTNSQEVNDKALAFEKKLKRL